MSLFWLPLTLRAASCAASCAFRSADEPNGGTDENCVGIFRGEQGRWADGDCAASSNYWAGTGFLCRVGPLPPAPPSLPPPPPPSPSAPVTPAERVANRLNWRFRKGKATSAVADAGVVMHQVSPIPCTAFHSLP